MKINIDNYNIDCFENELEYKNWIKDYNIESIYHGKLYSIPQDIKELFYVNVLVSIKKQNYNEVQYIFIHKNI